MKGGYTENGHMKTGTYCGKVRANTASTSAAVLTGIIGLKAAKFVLAAKTSVRTNIPTPHYFEMPQWP